MAPAALSLAPRVLRRAALSPELAYMSSHALVRRGLGVSDTQKVTLGVIGAYVVVIALLWNLPYIKWILWPFKVINNTLLSPVPSPLSSFSITVASWLLLPLYAQA